MVCVAYLTEAASLSSNLVQLFFLFSFVYQNSLGFFLILLVTVYASFPSIFFFRYERAYPKPIL
jgi:hypothetical protein